jgi:putative oxidoreductase
MGMSAELSLGLTIFAEVFCSLLILAGFATRLAVLPLIVTMSVAVLLIHSADPIAMKEPALQYLVVYLVLLFAGSGKYSVDGSFSTRKVTSSIKKADLKSRKVAIFQ